MCKWKNKAEDKITGVARWWSHLLTAAAAAAAAREREREPTCFAAVNQQESSMDGWIDSFIIYLHRRMIIVEKNRVAF